MTAILGILSIVFSYLTLFSGLFGVLGVVAGASGLYLLVNAGVKGVTLDKALCVIGIILSMLNFMSINATIK